jgi:hypothetical protein
MESQKSGNHLKYGFQPLLKAAGDKPSMCLRHHERGDTQASRRVDEPMNPEEEGFALALTYKAGKQRVTKRRQQLSMMRFQPPPKGPPW